MIRKIRLYFIACILVLNGCNGVKKDNIYLKINEVTILYTMPRALNEQIRYPDRKNSIYPIVPDNSKEKFISNVFLRINISIMNKSKHIISQKLNNLIVDRPSFDIDIFLKNRKIRFFNYPFSGNELYAENNFKLRPGEIKNFELESPIFFYSKKFDGNKLDSLRKELRTIKFEITEDTIQLDTSKIVINCKPVVYVFCR